MTRDDLTHPSHLYTVRLWLETLDDGSTEWRGKVQHVLTGERYYFRDWATMISHLLSMVPPERKCG